MKTTIITFNPHNGNTFNGILSATTIEHDDDIRIRNYEEYSDLSYDDFEIISSDSWEIDSDEFLSNEDRISECKDRAGYTDLILSKNIVVK
jgi:hypothetical protein